MSELKCSQKGCDAPPCFRYTWPGRDEQHICAIHALKLKGVAAAMGLHIQTIPLDAADYLKAGKPSSIHDNADTSGSGS